MRNTFWILFFFITCNDSVITNISIESIEINQRISDKRYIPIVTGQLLNYSNKQEPGLEIHYICKKLSAAGGKKKKATINPDGSFVLEIEKALPYQEIFIFIGDYYYGGILANHELHIVADLNELRNQSIRYYGKGINFEGSDANANLFVNKYYNFERDKRIEIKNKIHNIKINNALQLNEKIDQISSCYNELNIHNQAYINVAGNDFYWIIKDNYLSEFYGDLFLIHWGKAMNLQLFRECVTHEPKQISNASLGYYSYLQKYISTPTPSKIIEDVRKVLENNIIKNEMPALNLFMDCYEQRINNQSHSLEIFQAGQKQFLIKFEKELESAYLDLYLERTKLLSPIKASIIKLIGAPGDLLNRQTYIEKILPTIDLEWCKKLMQEYYETDKMRIDQINQALESETGTSTTIGTHVLSLENDVNLFVAEDTDVNSLIRAIRTRNEGQAIILDIWATWCGPCLTDMQQSAESKKKLTELGVGVIYICVENGSSLEKWKHKVADISTPGDHIFLNNKLSSELMQFFNFSGFPSYILIDKEGKVSKDLITSISSINLEKLKANLGI